MTCPQCGGTHVDRDEVDIGVGTQYGPTSCSDCGWDERDTLALIVGELPCESGHMWSQHVNDDGRPQPGTPCDCGMRKWGDSEHGA